MLLGVLSLVTDLAQSRIKIEILIKKISSFAFFLLSVSIFAVFRFTLVIATLLIEINYCPYYPCFAVVDYQWLFSDPSTYNHTLFCFYDTGQKK